MEKFMPDEFDRVVNVATDMSIKEIRPYLVRFNSEPPDCWRAYGYSALDAAENSDLRPLYENAEVLVRIDGGMITVMRDDCLYMEDWRNYVSMSQLEAMATKKVVPVPVVFELPWQQRKREEAEKVAAVVALRNNVRSTLGM